MFGFDLLVMFGGLLVSLGERTLTAKGVTSGTGTHSHAVLGDTLRRGSDASGRRSNRHHRSKFTVGDSKISDLTETPPQIMRCRVWSIQRACGHGFPPLSRGQRESSAFRLFLDRFDGVEFAEVVDVVPEEASHRAIDRVQKIAFRLGHAVVDSSVRCRVGHFLIGSWGEFSAMPRDPIGKKSQPLRARFVAILIASSESTPTKIRQLFSARS